MIAVFFSLVFLPGYNEGEANASTRTNYDEVTGEKTLAGNYWLSATAGAHFDINTIRSAAGPFLYGLFVHRLEDSVCLASFVMPMGVLEGKLKPGRLTEQKGFSYYYINSSAALVANDRTPQALSALSEEVEICHGHSSYTHFALNDGKLILWGANGGKSIVLE